MPASIIPQEQDGQELYNSISSFFSKFCIGKLLRKCNAQKEKSVPILNIFKYKLCNVFSDRSMYMQKKTEQGSRVFDHTSMRYCKGFRLMTLGWTDGNTYLPVNSSLLASSKEDNLIGPAVQYDGRSLAAKRRKLATMKGTAVMIELLRKALNAGFSADYVLFDTWFFSPAQLVAVKELGLDSIAMIKKNPLVYYEYEGKQLSIQKIFGICKKRRGRSKYLLSVNVMVGKD